LPVTSSVSSRVTPVLATLPPIKAVVLIGFLVIGLALPVLPPHVHQGLGFGTFVVGLVAGSQFAASLVSRVWSGHFADRRGAKRDAPRGVVRPQELFTLERQASGLERGG
jgi:MFS family permease